jgi:hypothetical protein
LSGYIEGGAPWTRAAIRDYRSRYPDALAAIETAIPDGGYLVLTSGRRYGSWGAVLMADNDQAPPREVGRASGCPTLSQACYAALEAGRVKA